MKQIPTFKGKDVRKLRKKIMLTQKEFWGEIGVLQTCGSRYELGEVRIPKPVRLLIHVYFVLNFDEKTWKERLDRIGTPPIPWRTRVNLRNNPKKELLAITNQMMAMEYWDKIG